MKKSKVLLTLMCAVALVATSVFGTLAYLQSTDEVVNTFTVGNVSIILDEKDVDGSKTDVTTEGRDKANAYHLLPGHVYDKDPTVTVLKDSEDSYVRMLMTINEQADLDAIFKKINEGREEKVGIINVLTGWDEEEWTLVKETENGDSRTYEFRYKEIVAQDKEKNTVLPALFTQIEMPGEITKEQLATITGLKIDVVAQAIQADGFDTADEAWAAF